MKKGEVNIKMRKRHMKKENGGKTELSTKKVNRRKYTPQQCVPCGAHSDNFFEQDIGLELCTKLQWRPGLHCVHCGVVKALWRDKSLWKPVRRTEGEEE